MEGYKTLIWNTLKIIFGALIAAGVMDASQQQAILDNMDGILGGGLIILGIVDTIFRKVTKGPMGKLLK